jgi:Arc/MetJ-type ribon-helix-helix transcriptional regulator
MEITISTSNIEYIKRLIETGNYSKTDEILNEAIQLHELFKKKSFDELKNKIKRE